MSRYLMRTGTRDAHGVAWDAPTPIDGGLYGGLRSLADAGTVAASLAGLPDRVAWAWPEPGVLEGRAGRRLVRVELERTTP